MSDAAKDEPELSEQDKALAKQWGKRLETALKTQTKDKTEARYKKLRKYVRGDVGGDDSPGLVRTNIIHSNFAAILPQIYAKNPELSVTPTEAAGKSDQWVPQFCKTMQCVLNRVFIKDAKLKKRAKSAIRAAMTTGIGWAKVSWQKDIKTDPLIESRMADSQDNLQRIRHLISEIEEDDDSRADLEAKQAELEQQLAAIEQQAEVVAVEGVVTDRVLTEDLFILDDTLNDFDGYDDADALAHRVWMTCDKHEQTFGKEPPKTANRYGGDKKERGTQSGVDDKVELVAVFEVWDRVSMRVYTLCAGSDEWARDPYTPNVIGKRFYPFFALAFNPTDGEMHPLADTELLTELQDEYNTTRTNFAEHRKENVPVRVYRKGGDLTDGDIKALANRHSNEWVGIEGNPDTPLQNDIAILQNPPVDPGTYDVQPILRDAEMVLGAGDAAKGSVNRAKTATEAEIMNQGLQSRVAERSDVVEDWIAEMAQFAAELCLQELTLEQVKRIAGADAVWPEMRKDDIFDLVQIEIRAGSTGRPNKNKEREQWGQMLPQIQKSIEQVMQLREAGQDDMAETVMKLLEETLRRFDERIDIESFLPPKKEGEQAPQIPPEIKQQIEQGQQMLKQLQAENEQLKQVANGSAEKMAFEREKLEFEKQKAADMQQIERDKIQSNKETAIEIAQINNGAKVSIEVAKEKCKVVADQQRAEHETYLMNPALADDERQSTIADQEAQRQMTQQLAQSIGAIGQVLGDQQKIMQALAEKIGGIAPAMQDSQAMMIDAVSRMGEVIALRMSAPKRILKDAEGNITGVETA